MVHAVCTHAKQLFNPLSTHFAQRTICDSSSCCRTLPSAACRLAALSSAACARCSSCMGKRRREAMSFRKGHEFCRISAMRLLCMGKLCSCTRIVIHSLWTSLNGTRVLHLSVDASQTGGLSSFLRPCTEALQGSSFDRAAGSAASTCILAALRLCSAACSRHRDSQCECALNPAALE